MIRRNVWVPQDISAWWYEILKNEALKGDTSGRTDNENWADGPITVSLAELNVRYADWGGERRPRQETMAKFLRAMCPKLTQGQYWINDLRILTVTLPSLDDCRLAFAAWEEAEQLSRAWMPYRAPAPAWERPASAQR